MKYAAKTITGIRKQNQDAVFIPERGIGIARESYVWPLIGFIASIIAFIAYSDALLRCPHCHSGKAMDMVRIRAIRPGFEFYCPMCGELIEIVEPDDPRLKK